ncbi:MAG: flagellar basal body P-ring formation protein FlgA [Desulfobacteraceae bacterium]|nr:flagellar basal body P-ring formation protein FlgA [Desulfobacteraceae bacterium]
MRILAKIIGFVLPLLVAATLVQGGVEKGIEIHINSDARVNAREYLLKDVARVRAPGMMKEELESFSMGFSPAIGEVKRLSGERLASKVRSISWLPETAEISFPDSVFIKRVSQEVPEETLRELYRDHIRERLGEQEFDIRDFRVRGLSLYPVGDMEFSVQSSRQGKAKGRVSLHVDVAVGNVSCGRISLSGWVDIYDTVVCSTRNLSRGDILQPGDLCLKRLNVSKLPDNYLTRIDRAPGMRVKQNIKTGGYLRGSVLEVPPLVKKGDNVTLVACKGEMRIKAIGIATRAGGLGDQIPVKNITTGKTVFGRISGPQTVDVFF